MFLFYYCIPMNDFSFDEKINLDKKNQLIELFSLINKGLIKEYWLNHIQIINHNFYSVNDISYEYKERFLIYSFKKDKLSNFQFFHVDTEYEYNLYENIHNDVTIRLKIFKNYITLEFENDSLNDFFDFIKENKYIINSIING